MRPDSVTGQTRRCFFSPSAGYAIDVVVESDDGVLRGAIDGGTLITDCP